MKISEMIDVKTESEKVNDSKTRMLEEIKADKDFYKQLLDLGLNDELISSYLGQLHSLYVEKKVCKECKNVNTCPFELPHLIRIPRVEGDFLSFEYGYCAKYYDVLRFQNNILVNDLNMEYASKTSKDLHMDAIRKPFVMKASNIYKKGLQDNNLLFVVGTPKSGCTYITSFFFAIYLKKYNCQGIYADASKRFDELNELLFKDKEAFNEQIEQFKNVDVLVLNKISSAYINDFIRDNIVYPIIAARYKNNKVTMITSEISLEDFITVISGKTDLGKIKGKQIYDLLKEFEQFNISSKIKLFR